MYFWVLIIVFCLVTLVDIIYEWYAKDFQSQVLEEPYYVFFLCFTCELSMIGNIYKDLSFYIYMMLLLQKNH
jgi:hypothetical protein